jgi:Flp pilus assembly protein TadG
MNTHQKIKSARQRGVVTIEFTLVAAIFFLALFSIMGIARLVYTYNAVVNDTRYGARLAVVCDIAAANNIKTKMVAKVTGLTAAKINLTYNPDGCSVATCTSVTVTISGFSVAIATPASFPLGSFTLPNFSTTLTRESMNSTNNSVCS